MNLKKTAGARKTCNVVGAVKEGAQRCKWCKNIFVVGYKEVVTSCMTKQQEMYNYTTRVGALRGEEGVEGRPNGESTLIVSKGRGEQVGILTQ